MTKGVNYRTVWNTVFEQHPEYHWDTPHPEVAARLPNLLSSGCRRILDVGVGSGRHALLLGRSGFSVVGMDVASLCVEWLAVQAQAEKLAIQAVEHDMREHPYPFSDGEFDAILAIQTIHHDTAAGVRKTIAELRRVLRVGGVLLASLPQSHQHIASRFHELAPATLVPLDGPEEGIPHLYFDKAAVRAFFGAFIIRQLSVDQWNHWFLVALAE